MESWHQVWVEDIILTLAKLLLSKKVIIPSRCKMVTIVSWDATQTSPSLDNQVCARMAKEVTKLLVFTL